MAKAYGAYAGLNESPSEKEGKFRHTPVECLEWCLNESPSEKEGKCNGAYEPETRIWGLNESPSKKEGKSRC